MRRPFALLFALCLSCALTAQNAADIQDFELEVTTLDNEELSHETLGDKVVLVDFWGTWCPPCRKMIPALKKLYDEYHEQGLEIVGLAYEKKETEAEKLQALRAFALANEIPYPLALGTETIQNQIPGFRGYPTLLCFKKGMNCAEVLVGVHSYEDLERFVVAALKEKAPAEKKEDAPVRATLQLAGERKLEIGGGRHVLLVLDHPRLPLAQAQRTSLAKFAESRGDKLEFVRATRADLLGEDTKLGDAVGIEKSELEKLGFGRAFPLVALFNAEGRRLFVTTGSGSKSFAQLEELLGKELPAAEEKQPEAAPEEAPKESPKKTPKAAPQEGGPCQEGRGREAQPQDTPQEALSRGSPVCSSRCPYKQKRDHLGRASGGKGRRGASQLTRALRCWERGRWQRGSRERGSELSELAG